MPSLNTEVCYQQPIQTLQLSDSTEIPDDWLKQLVDQIEDTDIPKQEIISIMRRFMIESLGLESSLQKLFTQLESPRLQSEIKQNILRALPDGLKDCAEGYHNRIQACLQSINFPDSVEKLISLYRYELVDNIARKIANASQEAVHFHNGVFMQAQKMGLGVLPIRQDDQHRAMLEHSGCLEQAKTELERIFKDKYSFFNILVNIYNKIQNRLPHLGYTKKLNDEQNYGAVAASDMLDFIKQYLPDADAEDILVMSEDGARYIGLNWVNIRLGLLNRLVELNYFSLSDSDTVAIYYIKSLLSASTESSTSPPQEFYTPFKDSKEFYDFIRNYAELDSSRILNIILNKPNINRVGLAELQIIIELLAEPEIIYLLQDAKPNWLLSKLQNKEVIVSLLSKFKNPDNQKQFYQQLNPAIFENFTLIALSEVLQGLSVDSWSDFNNYLTNSFVQQVHGSKELSALGCKLSLENFEKLIEFLDQDRVIECIKGFDDILNLAENLSSEQLGWLIQCIDGDRLKSIINENSLVITASNNYYSNSLVKILRAISKDYLNEIISNEDTLDNMMEYLNDGQRRILLERIGGEHLAKIVKNEIKFLATIVLLNNEQACAFVEGYPDEDLKNKIPDWVFLEGIITSVDNQVVAKIIEKIDAGTLGEYLLTMDRIIELMEVLPDESHKILFEKIRQDKLQAQVISNLMEDDDCGRLLYNISPQCKWEVVQEILASDQLRDFINLKFILAAQQGLTPGNRRQLLRDIITYEKILGLISTVDELREVYKVIDENDKQIFLHSASFNQLISNLDHLEELLVKFPEQRNELIYNIIGLDKISTYIKDLPGLENALKILDLDDDNKQAFLQKLELNKLVNSVTELNWLLSLVGPSLQLPVTISYLGVKNIAKLITTVESFATTYDMLDEPGKEELLANYDVKRLINIPSRFKELLRYFPQNKSHIINTVVGFEHVVLLASQSVSNYHQIKTVLDELNNRELLLNLNFDVLIPNVSALCNFMYEVDQDQYGFILSNVVGLHRIKKLVSNVENFTSIWCILRDPEQKLIFDHVEFPYEINSIDDIYEILTVTGRPYRFKLLQQLVGYNKLPDELKQQGHYLVKLGAKHYTYLQNYLNFEKEPGFESLKQTIDSIPENIRYEFMAEVIGFEKLFQYVNNCDQLRLTLESVKKDEEHDEIINNVSEAKWAGLIKSSLNFKDYANLLKPRHLQTMMSKFSDKKLLALIPRSATLDIVCDQLSILGLNSSKYDVIFSALSDETCRSLVGSISILNKYLRLLSKTSRIDFITKIGPEALMELCETSDDIYELVNFRDIQYKTHIINLLGIDFIAEFYYDASFDEFIRLLDAVHDNDLKTQVIKKFSRLHCLDDYEITAKNLNREKLGLTAIQFDELLKAFGSRKLSEVFTDTRSVIGLLSKLKKDDYKYKSGALLNIAESHEFKLMMYGTSFIAVGIIGCAFALTAAAAVVIAPTLGVTVLGYMGYNIGATAVTLGTAIVSSAAIATSVGSIVGGVYELHKRAQIGRLTDSVCGRSEVKHSLGIGTKPLSA